MAMPADPPPERGRNWQELLVTVLLVVAALATSWSSYQATRWNGEQAAAAGRTNAIRIDAARADGLARSQTQIDVATFIAWADADQRGETKVADFYVDRFRDEFRPAYEAWIALRPLTNADAPSTPFAMEEYQVAAKKQAAELDAAAEASAARGADRHPALEQLRPDRGAVRHRALLRGDEHAARATRDCAG